MRRHVLAAVLLAVVACGGDKTTGTQSVTGSYTLRTVNGGNLPAVVYEDALEKDEVLSGTINLSADMTWSGTLGIRQTDKSDGSVFAPPLVPISGTYALSGSSITIQDRTFDLTFTGTVGGGKLAIGADLIGAGVVTAMVYQK